MSTINELKKMIEEYNDQTKLQFKYSSDDNQATHFKRCAECGTNEMIHLIDNNEQINGKIICWDCHVYHYEAEQEGYECVECYHLKKNNEHINCDIPDCIKCYFSKDKQEEYISGGVPDCAKCYNTLVCENCRIYTDGLTWICKQCHNKST